MKSYVVAGATGRVGSVVANDLLDSGASVITIVRDASRAAGLDRKGASLAIGTLDDRAFLTDALRGATAFLALLPDNPVSDDFHRERRLIADSIAAAVQESAVPLVVMLSAPVGALAEGSGPGRGLHHLENSLRTTGATITTLRSAFYQDSVMLSLQLALQQGIYPNFLPSADFPFSTIATRDVGRIAAAALRDDPRENQVVDLIGPPYSVRQLADALGEALGKTLAVVDIPPAAQVEALKGAGMSQSFAEAVAEMYACSASGRLSLQGDRQMQGDTTVRETVAAILAAQSHSVT